MGFLLGALAFGHRIPLLDPNRRIQPFFIPHRQLDVLSLEPLQCQLFKPVVMLPRRDIAVGGKDGVARVVVVAIELLQILVAQVYDVVGLATAVVVISRGREQMTRQVLPQLGRGRAHGALHFVVDHATVDQLGLRVVRRRELQAVALLGKIQWVQPCEKHRIEIHRQQVVEVLAVHAGKRVSRPVAAGERIHEGVQRPANHHEKRIANRVLLTAAQHRVLQNMSHAGGVHREGAQGHEKHVLIVVRSQMQVAGAGFLMHIFFNLQVERANPVTAKLFKGRVGCVVYHCRHSIYPVFKAFENCRVTRSIDYHAQTQSNQVTLPPMTASTPDSKPLDAPEVAAYWAERRRYLERIRKDPEIRQRFWREVGIYLLRRILWSFGFFPVLIAFWVPLVLSSFNPVVMASELIPLLQNFVNANPEVQANTLSTLTIAWLSIGFFFLVFDFVLTPFRSPYEYEADVYMRSWEQLNHDQLPDKV